MYNNQKQTTKVKTSLKKFKWFKYNFSFVFIKLLAMRNNYLNFPVLLYDIW